MSTNDITNDRLVSKPANDNYRNSSYWETRKSSKLSEFIRNATPEEKEKVYSEVMDEVAEIQADTIAHFLRPQAS